VWLGGLLSRVVDPSEPWPTGTTRSGTRTYSFDCVTQLDSASTTAFKVEYVDYAGEIFELLGEGDTALDDLFGRVRAADALIGVLDGRRVTQFLRGEAAGRAYLVAKIAVLVQLMAQARCAVYLVVSKWDLVHGVGEPPGAGDRERLELVSRALMTVDQIQDLVQTRTTVRLIPVSAVGAGFAALDESTGVVRKLPDGTFAPYNVELPIAAVVPDLFARIREEMHTDTVKAIASEYSARRRRTPDEVLSSVGSFLLQPAGAALRASIDGILHRPYGNEMVVMMLDWIAGPSRRKAADLATFRTEVQRHTYALWEARSVVLDDFQKQVARLEVHLPASVLSR
jgi:hypothetical protein